MQRSYAATDGTGLAYRVLGEGRSLILLHGVLTDASSWVGPGHVDQFVGAGYRVILPDFRGHGDSGKPHDAASYPPDVLTSDILELIAHLSLVDYDLAGYSLGGRIAARAMIRGAEPRRAVIGGQGLEELQGSVGRVGTQVRKVFGPGGGPLGPEEAAFKERLLERGIDPIAVLNVLNSLVPTPPSELARIQTPTLVLIGTRDERAASANQLGAVLTNGSLRTISGTHVTAAMSRDLGTAIVEFLGQ